MRAPIPHLPSRNVRNKKTKNPGYQGGNHWVVCDRCGCSVRASESCLTWEGFVVCLDDWEPRHPQDFVRARIDRIAPEGHVRPDSSATDTILNLQPQDRVAIAAIAIAGKAVSGVTTSFSSVPPGNNNNEL